MKRKYRFLPVVLSLLLVLGCMVPSAVFAEDPSREGQSKTEAPAVEGGMSLLADSGLVVESNKTAEQLAQKLVGDAVTISAVTYTGDPLANGFFSGGTGIIGFEEGIILSSGVADDVVGPNYSGSNGVDFEGAGDEDLDQLIDAETNTQDAAVLEFDFIPENDVISFSYVFGSDEYNEYVNSEYNDVFGFFLNGKNVALVPGTTDTAVSVNNVNGGKPFGTDATNPDYYRNNDLEDGGATINTEMDGLTVVLQVEAPVIPNETNHIKLAIADVSDGVYDSVVFLKAGSFDDELPQPGNLSFKLNEYSVDENEASAEITVVRSNGTDGEVSVSYATADDSATEGADYTSASGILTFGDGDTEKSFIVPILDDDAIEGDEAVQLSLDNPTGGAALGEGKTATLTIRDNEKKCIVEGCETLQTEGGFTTCSELPGGEIVYHIETAEQLAHICEHMDLDYIQTKDIDLAESEFSDGWIPIGGFDGASDFNGSYIGNGFEIKNMVLHHTASSGNISAGLFAKASDKSHLENISLTINDINLERAQPEGQTKAEQFTGDIFVGGITGEHYANYTIENCRVTIGAVFAANAEGDIYVGGVSGANSGSISGCEAAFVEDVIMGADYGDLFFGGITAYNEYSGGLAQNRSTIGDVSIYSDEDAIYGGIAGVNYGGISDCHSESNGALDVYLFGYVDMPYGEAYIGGICGYTSGTITDSGQTGGIEAAVNCETMKPTLMGQDAVNSNPGKAAADSESKILESETDTNSVYAGGIAGYVVPNESFYATDQEYNPASIFNSDHTGDITVQSGEDDIRIDHLYVGGIAGYLDAQGGDMRLIENCQNNGTVIGDNLFGSAFSGGIAGYIAQEVPKMAVTATEFGSGATILNCANVNPDSETEANGYFEMAIAGGIVGGSRFIPESQPTIENCYNRSDVVSKVVLDDDEKIDTLDTGKGYQCEGAASGGIIGASGGANVLTSYSSADLITSSAIVPVVQPQDSMGTMAMPVETQSGYAGGIAGLIWDTEFDQNYFETNENVIDGIGGAVVESAPDEVSVAVSGYPGYEIIQPGTDPGVSGANAAQLKTKSFFGDAWRWYTSGGADPQYYSSDEPWRMIAADAYPVLRGKPYQTTPPSNHNGGGSSVETPPPVSGLPDGTLIDRMAGYVALSKPAKFNEVKAEIELTYDTSLQKNNSPRIYYWNAEKKNWVALATYPVSNGKVKAANDGKYKGWFVVFGVIQPEFSDIQKNWAEKVMNRMNGLGMVEGYPAEDGSLLRTVLPDREVSYAEFTMLISRLLNIDIDDPRLPLISKEASLALLNESFTDGDEIPGWVLQVAGTLDKANILPENRAEFRADTAITRVEAAVMISKALNLLTEGKKADLSKFTDLDEIPDWAKGELVEGAMLGYPDGTFRPNGHLTRAESLTMLHRLFVEGLGW